MNKSFFIRFFLTCSVFLFSFDTLWSQNDLLPESTAPPPKKTYTPEPVVPFRDTLFYINSGIGSFSREERAVSIAQKIRKVSKEWDDLFGDSLTILAEGNMVEIAFGDIIIMTITENDAKFMGKTQIVLANEYKTNIKNAIVQHHKDTGWLTILWRGLWILLIVVTQYFLIKIINFLFRKLSAKVNQLKGKKINTIRFKSYKLLDEEKVIKCVLFIAKILH